MIKYFEKNKNNIISKVQKNKEKYKDILNIKIGLYNIYEFIDYNKLYNKYLKI